MFFSYVWRKNKCHPERSRMYAAKSKDPLPQRVAEEERILRLRLRSAQNDISVNIFESHVQITAENLQGVVNTLDVAALVAVAGIHTGADEAVADVHTAA